MLSTGGSRYDGIKSQKSTWSFLITGVDKKQSNSRTIFVWPWNENALTKQKEQTNGNRAIWLVHRMDTNARGFCLVKRKLRELSRNQSILCFDVILQHDWPIKQCFLHVRVFFGGKTKSPCFDLFIHWLIKQITNTYLNYFSRSYENLSKWRLEQKSLATNTLTNSKCKNSFWQKTVSKAFVVFYETYILSKHRN